MSALTPAQAAQQNNRTTDGKYASKTTGEAQLSLSGTQSSGDPLADVAPKRPEQADYQHAASSVAVTPPVPVSSPFNQPKNHQELAERFIEHRQYWIDVADQLSQQAQHPGPFSEEILADAQEALAFAAHYSPEHVNNRHGAAPEPPTPDETRGTEPDDDGAGQHAQTQFVWDSQREMIQLVRDSLGPEQGQKLDDLFNRVRHEAEVNAVRKASLTVDATTSEQLWELADDMAAKAPRHTPGPEPDQTPPAPKYTDTQLSDAIREAALDEPLTINYSKQDGGIVLEREIDSLRRILTTRNFKGDTTPAWSDDQLADAIREVGDTTPIKIGHRPTPNGNGLVFDDEVESLRRITDHLHRQR